MTPSPATNNIQYTAQFGKRRVGHDRSRRTRSGSTALACTTCRPPRAAGRPFRSGLPPLRPFSAIGLTGNSYGAVHYPDVVGKHPDRPGLGSVPDFGQRGHEVDASYNRLTLAAANNFSEINGHPGSKVGRLRDGRPCRSRTSLGVAGDDIKMDASWAKGDMKNIIGTSAGVKQPFAIFGGNNGVTYQEHRVRRGLRMPFLPSGGGRGCGW